VLTPVKARSSYLTDNKLATDSANLLNVKNVYISVPHALLLWSHSIQNNNKKTVTQSPNNGIIGLKIDRHPFFVSNFDVSVLNFGRMMTASNISVDTSKFLGLNFIANYLQLNEDCKKPTPLTFDAKELLQQTLDHY
jgi:hypothetical protein